jgi:hypothetical protein
MNALGASAALVALSLAACAGRAKTDPRYPPRPDGCDVKMFHGKVEGVLYDDIGHVDAICSIDMAGNPCVVELKNQACKLGGDLLYDVPYEAEKPSPDKLRLTGRVAHSRASSNK